MEPLEVSYRMLNKLVSADEFHRFKSTLILLPYEDGNSHDPIADISSENKKSLMASAADGKRYVVIQRSPPIGPTIFEIRNDESRRLSDSSEDNDSSDVESRSGLDQKHSEQFNRTQYYINDTECDEATFSAMKDKLAISDDFLDKSYPNGTYAAVYTATHKETGQKYRYTSRGGGKKSSEEIRKV
eukprot:TRINITY_DN14848_c0_g1_i1.p1 TRINITY_DN14848_c0_g1~~TRINITY_DN14848_c0_g1_i1.p1  ORF type:complete len:186 (+),score=25.57 TRINITY_DN14848_c0_g1_i1:40-597(+)